jgi:muramoyltetrapeptide carboxypeptidase
LSLNSDKYLKKGDEIRILCTARSAQESDLQSSIKLLTSWGYRVSLGETINKKHHQFGGTNEERISDFQNAIDDPNVAAIWIARGGYGSVQIIDQLHFTRDILLLGYSDITLLHAKLNNAGMKSIHSWMPLELKHKTPESIESLQQILTGTEQEISIPFGIPGEEQVIKAPIVGGNLSIIYSLLGSEDSLNTKDCILFIEEIDEYLYHVERMMYSLKRAGLFNKIKALLVGGMTQMNDHEIPFGKTAKEIIMDIMSPFDIPILFDVPAGHVKDHRCIPLQKPVELIIGAQNSKLIY